MKAAEKNRQQLSSLQSRTPNAKYNSRRWKISLSTLKEYIQYMSDESFENTINS